MARKKYFRNEPMTYDESLYFCGCESCKNEIRSRDQENIPYQTGFLDYIADTYPETLAQVNNEPR
jgi:hypothetical protein